MSESGKQQVQSARRLEISPRLRAMMRYPKFAGAVPRVLILQSNYWLDSACRRAAERLGWELRMAPVVLEGAMPREMVAGFLEALTTFNPDFVLTVNLSGMDDRGLFAALLADLEIPYVTWFVDDPRTIIMGRTCYASPYAVALTWEPAYVEYLKAVGFPEVAELPLAADRAVFDAPPAGSHEVACSFVGSSMAGYAQREWAWFEHEPALASALRDAFEQGRVTRQSFGAGMDQILGDEIWSACSAEARRHLELVCFIEGTRRLREQLVKRLAPQGLVVRGDDFWRALTPHAGPPADYEQELPQWYRECAVNLNTTSLQMASTVNQRVFDCPAAGGFLLTDAQPALERLFEPDEVAIYHDLDECDDLLKHWLNHDSARTRIVDAARSRIFAQHTYEHRLRAMKTLLEHRFG